MDYLATIANTLFISGYLVRDMLKLRLLSLVGTCCLAVYFCALSEPLMHMVAWNVFYALLNAAWVIRLLADKRIRTVEATPGIGPQQAEEEPTPTRQTSAAEAVRAGEVILPRDTVLCR